MNLFKYIFIISSLSYINVANAFESEQTCNKYAELARIIMQNRQNGVPITEIMQKIDGGQSTGSLDLFKSLALSAYKHGQYNSPEYRQNSITEFSNSAYLECIEAFNKPK